MRFKIFMLCCIVSGAAACSRPGDAAASGASTISAALDASPVASFQEPWTVRLLPDGGLLVTEKKGNLKRVAVDGSVGDISGVPEVDYGGQGGFGDVALHPEFARNGIVYLSYIEAGSGDTHGAVVARAKLSLDAGGGTLSELSIIWRQLPKFGGRGHYGHRLRFGPDGKLWVSSGDRQEFSPAQDMSGNLGKMIRLNEDGSVVVDNPFAERGAIAAQAWSVGHRNILGFDFDAKGRLWAAEMGPKGGDELNLVERGRNYGWPTVSDGSHYDGRDIPDHRTAPRFAAPAITWTPVIAPGDMLIYAGGEFAQWKGNALIAGLASAALVRVQLDGDSVREVARYPMGSRIRSIEQGRNGELWLLEDGPSGRLLRIRPARK